MATIDDLSAALVKADAAGDAAGAKILADHIRSMSAAPVAQTPQALDVSTNPVVALGGGLGAGFGKTVLGAQRYLGKGLDAVGMHDAGKWLVNDAEKGRANLTAELAPYKKVSPISANTGEIGGEVVATLPVGGALAGGAKVLGASPAIVNALASGGLKAEGANMLTRIAGGAINGGVSAALVDPKSTKAGAVIGGAIPIVGKLGGMAGQYVADGRSALANKLMNSALKPTLAQKQSGDAAVAVQTLLDNGINPTKGGVNKLREMIDGLNENISNRIANSDATISKGSVLNALSNVRNKFSNQVSPTADLSAIKSVADDFVNHPNIIGDSIPVQEAQKLKQGTYKVLSGKYGEAGSAATEAQKGLARGLKEGIADAVPGIGSLNAQESKLLTTLDVTERRALMDLNKNPMGLAALAHNPASWAMFMADKSALFKSLAARMVNPTNTPVLDAGNALLNSPTAAPLLRSGAAIYGANRNNQQ